ncbi:MAG TPA: maltose ABC transporter permease MalF [Usitatibacteraceae bacterium]|nr:maltose ABC transporter permease MalF [Usitatibacteraceae bacterium]
MTTRAAPNRAIAWTAAAALAALCIYLALRIIAAGEWMAAGAFLTIAALGFFVYLGNVAFAYRYLYPGLAAMAVFVLFPLLYTAQIGFTNYSSAHLLSESRARQYLLDQVEPDDSRLMEFSLHADGTEYRIAVRPLRDGVAGTLTHVSAPIALKGSLDVPLQRVDAALPPLSQALPLNEVLRHRAALMSSRLLLPDGTRLQYTGVREFAPVRPLWTEAGDGALRDSATGATYRPNRQGGHFEDATGKQLQPGFKVHVGLANYARMVNDPEFRGPFLSIFTWTVVFAGMTVLLTLALGMPLAVLLNWESLRYRSIYRTLLFLPYAVPAFISILVFKGLFNQNFGEINTLLNAVFGIRPAWFADPTLAKVMILIVNTWLGYPYVMILCSGLIKSIPPDLYEASALAGASPWMNFRRITAPLIIKPLAPLLVTIFAFNFNNFVVIALLTDGRPDHLNTKLPAGTTDILVSYTYRIAFQDSGQNFGLAAAISTVIFFMIALMSLANMKVAKVAAGER